MPRIPIALLALSLVAWSWGAPRTQAWSGESAGEIVAPFVDRQTLLIAHVNLLAFDAMKSVDWLAELFELPDEVRDRLQAQAVPINVIAQTLPRDASVDVFIVNSLTDVGRLPFFLVLPLTGHTPATAIAAEARRDLEKSFNRPLQTARIGEALILGSAETVERLKKDEPVARPEVGAALSAAGPAALSVAFVPSAEWRKLFEKLVPQLPQSLGGGPTSAFTQGVTWVATGLDLPPKKIAIRVVVQSTDAAAATALEAELSKLFAAVGKLPAMQKALPDFAELSQKLLPTASGDQLKLDLNDDNGGIAALTQVAAPVLHSLMATETPE